MLPWKEKIKAKNVSSFKHKVKLLLPEDSIVHTHVLVLNHKHVCRHSWTKETICLYRQILFSEHGNWNIKLNHTFYKYVQATVCLFWPRVQETLSETIVYCLSSMHYWDYLVKIWKLFRWSNRAQMFRSKKAVMHANLLWKPRRK